MKKISLTKSPEKPKKKSPPEKSTKSPEKPKKKSRVIESSTSENEAVGDTQKATQPTFQKKARKLLKKTPRAEIATDTSSDSGIKYRI